MQPSRRKDSLRLQVTVAAERATGKRYCYKHGSYVTLQPHDPPKRPGVKWQCANCRNRITALQHERR